MLQQSAMKSDAVDLATLNANIIHKRAKVGVIGLGYVGLPLVKALNKQDYHVIGFDVDTRKIESIQQGKSYIKSVKHEDIIELNNSGKFFPTSEVSHIAEMDVILICVPTPLTKNREPDMRYVISSAETIATQLRKNQLVILESTTYPGTTQELLKPIFEKKGFIAGQDFFLAYSPEREDPGNGIFETSMIPKVVGADDPSSRQLALSLYAQIVPKVVEVSSAAAAEAVKLTENIFRFVNIGLVNELKTIFSQMNIDIWEVIDAAKTKPFGYMPFYPGPGLGGHCIPIDPFYLTWKAREYGLPTQFIELSGNINGMMSSYVIEKLREELDLRFCKGLRGTKILVAGMAYKKNIDDIRESPSLVIFELLQQRKSLVEYFDTHVPEIPFTHEHPNLAGLKSIHLTKEKLKEYDAVVICTDHDDMDYSFLVEHAKLIIDTRNAVKDVARGNGNVVKA
jgi:UDP-N-acetyl-D-glucosamine dehydrogenase